MDRRRLALTGPVVCVLFFAAIFVVDDDGPGDKPRFAGPLFMVVTGVLLLRADAAEAQPVAA